MMWRGQNQRIPGVSSRGICRIFSILFIASVLLMGTGITGSTDVEIVEVNLWVSHSTILNFQESVTKVIVADPEIADVNVTSPKHVLVTAKQEGYTSIVIWGEDDKYYHYGVKVGRKRKEQQVMLQVRFAEMSRGGLKELGAHFIMEHLSDNADVTAASFGGRVNTPSIEPQLGDNVHFFFSILSKKPPYNKLSSIIRALEQKRVLSTLAEPNLVAADGENATFLSGGEFPVPVVQGTAGMQTVTIIFKEFGVKLEFTPTILDDGTIRLKVAPEVSSLDFENGVVLSGFRIPSLLTRKTATTVELKDGQGLVIGGLLTHEMIDTITRIPILGQIPLLGKLFSSKRLTDNESELIILIVPQIVEPLEADAIDSVKIEK